MAAKVEQLEEQMGRPAHGLERKVDRTDEKLDWTCYSIKEYLAKRMDRRMEHDME
jgi:hypothetical protein